MFIAAAGGGALVWRISHDNYSDYSDYSDYSRHSEYTEYGDSTLRNNISKMEDDIRRKESDVEILRQRMISNFDSLVNELKRKKNYPGLDATPSTIVNTVKYHMKRELDDEIAKDKQELAEIDKMIARINELELQAKQDQQVKRVHTKGRKR